MRVLVTTTGKPGHFGPLIPFATAVRARGDDVLVATRASTADVVRRAGFEAWPFADAPAEERSPVFGRIADLPDDEKNRIVVSEVFARIDSGAALPGVLEAVEAWRPDLVLHETCEFAGGLAAERAGIPGVRVGVTLGYTEALVMGPASAALQGMRAELDLPPDPGGERVTGAPYFTLHPPLLEHPDAPGVPGARRFRENVRVAYPLPDWWEGSRAPLVYVTFGTMAGGWGMYPDLYRATIDALAGLPVRLLVTIGRDADPGELGTLPANVHVEQWVPQADVMPEAAAIVCHGGSGTVRAGLAAGVPMAVLPLFADQPYNAQRVAELGAGIALPGGPQGAGAAHDAVQQILADPAYREAAEVVAEDVRRLPTVDAAAELLRELALQSALR